MEVPFTRFSRHLAPIRNQLTAAFERVVDSGQYIQGLETVEFEKEFAAYCGTFYGSGIANGTCSLHLLFKSIGVANGDEVITVPNSFVASTSTIALTGALPVFVDVTNDLNIDPVKIEQAITPRTKAIIPVHLAGRPAKMPAIIEIA